MRGTTVFPVWISEVSTVQPQGIEAKAVGDGEKQRITNSALVQGLAKHNKCEVMDGGRKHKAACGATHDTGQNNTASGAAARGHGGARPKVKTPNSPKSCQGEKAKKLKVKARWTDRKDSGTEGRRGAGREGYHGVGAGERVQQGVGGGDGGSGGKWRGETDWNGGEKNDEGGAEFKEKWRNRGGERDDRRGTYSVDTRRGITETRENGGERRRNETRSVGKAEAPQGGGLGFKKLEELSTKDPSDVAIIISSHRALKTVLGESSMRKDMVELLCLVLSKAFKSRTDRGTLQHLAAVVKDSGFLRTVLPHYVVGMGSEFNAVHRAQYPQQLENILVILTQVLCTFPSSVQPVTLLLRLLPTSICSLRALGVNIPAQIEENMEHLQGLIRHLETRSREGTLHSHKDTYALLSLGGDNPDEEDLQDFRTIPIYPTPEELRHEERPCLRPNLTSQCYPNAHLYLDTHFRLLREDFVRPLRERIQELLRTQMNIGRVDNPENQVKTKRLDDSGIYYDTKLVALRCTNSGIACIVQFNVEPLKFVCWQSSKRLMFGSLVCLSSDNFETFLYATVSDRDPKSLEEGQVEIIVTEESRNKLAIEQKQVFLMVETPAYFEAYRYVLEGLQELQEDELPFQRYLVECNPHVLHPAYLQRADTYDLSPVAHPSFKTKIKPFHCLDTQAWPKMEELGLDESQLKAFQLAITKELAIIQGPPGTGKTHVGLKIVQALLTNKDLWRPGTNEAPLLVVCYTNHALDQFLEGIYKFLPKGIVRVGGCSNSEILKRFNLRTLATRPSSGDSLSKHLLTEFHLAHRELCKVEQRLHVQSMELGCSLEGVLHENVLQRFISEQHWIGLNVVPTEEGFEVCAGKKSSLIMEWLGLGSLQQRETETVPNNQYQHPEEFPAFINEKEAELLEAERIINDFIYCPDGRDGNKKEDIEQAVRALTLTMTLDEPETSTEPNAETNEGWQIQPNQKKKLKNRIKDELRESSTMTEAQERQIADIWSLSLQSRWKLYRLWVSRYRTELRTKAFNLEQKYQRTVDTLAHVKRQQDVCLLKKATVIGMTTTGAAKFRHTLQEVRPSLVIVEEAAEVLEAHIITTLSRACQHLILIGDHQQLRPSATVFELAKNFGLEMSLFERLVNMGLPYVRLTHQHRMMPDIARLLTPHIYSELENNPSVLEYKNIKGLNTNVFFVEHKHKEEEIRDGRSHQNKHEAKFVVALCRYLLFQEYKPEQITILTTYTGQLHCLRKLMPDSQYSGVKVHVVDKYQGEENDIILLSLVRSNSQGRLGFLKIPNRVCVALSRAKKGLYCIGDSEMLGKVKLWSDIFHTLREKDQIGTALTLCCQNHPSRQVQASCASDFKQAPEGGCTQPCEYRLDCGHVCSKVCHPYDAEHKEYRCLKKCQKVLCDLGHSCPLVCYETCGDCKVLVEKVMPKCQHKQIIPCHQDPATFQCQEPCEKTLECGHPCDLVCGQFCTTSCKVKITLQLKCGHIKQDSCFYKTQRREPACNAPCKQQLKCGHACHGECHRCHQGRYHCPCLKKCDRLLICSHKCLAPCTNCPPCGQKCENRCIHSQCFRLCGQPCSPCVEPCAWQCPHQSCTKLCHEPCDRPPCDQPCDKFLYCGHPCIGLCGEKCPNKCRICDHEEVTEIFFGFEDDPNARFIELKDCGHIIESRAMDQYMEMDEKQQVNEEEVAIKLKECPRCRTPIRKNLRYGSHINRCLAEIEVVKQKIAGNKEDIQTQIRALQIQWEENKHMTELPNEYIEIKDKLSRYLTAFDLWIIENKMNIYTRLAKLLVTEKEKMSSKEGLKFKERIQEFLNWLKDQQQRFTEQQVCDLERELRRLTMLAELNAHCKMAHLRGESYTIQAEAQSVREILERCGMFTEQDETGVKDTLEELKKKAPLQGLGISEEERKMIVSAINMPMPGHWFKCPNGHVYLITECGGAMERAQCPECKAVIGGVDHRMESRNQLASEMDGAQLPAWPTALQ